MAGAYRQTVTPDEEASLLKDHDRGEKKDYERAFCRFAGVICVLGLILVATGVAFVLARIDQAVHDAQVMSAPYVEGAINNTAAILDNAAAMSHHVHTMTEQGEVLSTYSLPELIASVNATAQIMKKFQRLANHPMLQISLEEEHG